ncbi:helix-turn-helix domain-containing protein [Shivajiella indica]|uniref:Helix-turn-helix domain-containing protein n=1 Tax=Shivajiella indica TaxID=872115 RepID=A0ABW5BC39_9BACT
MKQPLLGQKIQEWRKAKGLTQEELVERCNINVRTIQRIEAGEVTPRSYTVKAILEVLEVNPSEIKHFNIEDAKNTQTNNLATWLKFSFIAGIIYLILAMVESILDLQIFVEKSSYTHGFGYLYTLLKTAVLFSFLLFTSAFYRLGEEFSNLLLKVTSIFLMILTGAFILEDVLTYWMGTEIYSGILLRSLISGILYVLFATGFIHLSNTKGTTYIIVGALGIVTGISFMTVVFAVPGLFFLTLFEGALIFLLHQEYRKRTSDNSISFISQGQSL